MDLPSDTRRRLGTLRSSAGLGLTLTPAYHSQPPLTTVGIRRETVRGNGIWAAETGRPKRPRLTRSRPGRD